MSLTDPFLIRNLVYGIEDSIISTTGVVVGIAMTEMKRKDILVTGAILVLAEALSMSFGSFVSEDSFMTTANMSHTALDVVKYAMVMFVAYIVAGLVPMLPFIFDLEDAWKYSFGLACVALFTLMYAFDRNPKKALALASIGGGIIGVSVMAGRALK